MDGNDLEGAIATFKEIERRYPEDMRSVVRLGFLMYEARDFAGAAARFERAFAADPQEYEYAFFLGVARRRMGIGRRARSRPSETIPPEHAHYAEARMQIASILERRGDYQGAHQGGRARGVARARSPARALQGHAAREDRRFRRRGGGPEASARRAAEGRRAASTTSACSTARRSAPTRRMQYMQPRARAQSRQRERAQLHRLHVGGEGDQTSTRPSA